LTTQSRSSQERGLVGHIEAYLGTIECGWSRSPDGQNLRFQVAKCVGGQIEEAVCFTTLGLSDHPLPSFASKKKIRHELFIAAPVSFGDRNIPAILQQIASDSLFHRSAMLCGEVIARPNPVFGGKPFTGFCAAIPSLLPEQFATWRDTDGAEVVFVWMVPLTQPEIDFVRREGWRKLEDISVARQVDLVDMDRASVV
jgi:hypothetical protein